MPKSKTPPLNRTLTRKPRSERDNYVALLEQLQSPTAVIVKNAPGHTVLPPMLASTAALYLAVYDGLIPETSVHKLHILLKDLPRHPRKGQPKQWPLAEA